MIAAEAGLPYACIPAGTRNHFALDLGVDRDDVVGALDAFVSGGERLVDLAEVNGRVFVNNVSLGLYANAVAQAGYRDAKLRTLLEVVPDSVGPEAATPDLTWSADDGQFAAVAVLVSNDAYSLEPGIGSGTRPRLDGGVLRIAAFGARELAGLAGGRPELRLRQWEAPNFELDAPGPVPAGIDGEAALLEPPLRFGARAAALRVRIAPGHPGVSPSAIVPATPLGVLRALLGFAFGR